METALLAAVLAARPDDDGPRLVYADWLTERGDPRGEFIQLQCQAARMPDGPERRLVDEEAQLLLAAHRAAWEAPLRAVGSADLAWERGFASALTYFGEDAATRFADEAPALFRLAPIRGLKLSSAHGFDDRFVSGGWRAFTPRALERLAATPQLARLERFTLYAASAGGEPALFRSPHLADLHSLTVAYGAHLGVIARCDAPGRPMAALRRLELRNSPMGTDAALALARRPVFPGLRRLAMVNASIGSPGASAFALSALTTRLHVLDLTNAGIHAEGALALAGSPHLGRLQTLAVSAVDVGTEGLEALATAPKLGRLVVADVSAHDEALVALLRRRFGERLTIVPIAALTPR